MNRMHDPTVHGPMHNLATAHGPTHGPAARDPTVRDSMHNLATHCPATRDLVVCII